MGMKKIAFIQLDHLVRSGKPVSEMARRLNITKGAVSKALKRLNVALITGIFFCGGSVRKRRMKRGH